MNRDLYIRQLPISASVTNFINWFNVGGKPHVNKPRVNNEDIARWRQKNDTAAIMIDRAATLLDGALHAFYASRATPPCPRFDVVYFEADMDGVVRGIVIDAETDGEYKMRDIVDLRDKETFARHIDLIAGAMSDMLDAHGIAKLVRIDVDKQRITVSII